LREECIAQFSISKLSKQGKQKMNRRDLLKASTLPVLSYVLSGCASAALGTTHTNLPLRSRLRPGDSKWPSEIMWQELQQAVGGRLIKLNSPFANCSTNSADANCNEAFAQLNSAFYIGDQPALTQTSGWIDAWISHPSTYAVSAKTTTDVVAAVNFARTHSLRLAVKGGGHSYQGTSSAPDSLLVWTRQMNNISLHENFIAKGCAEITGPQHAVSVGAGAMWIDAYHAVTTLGGRYVQGGGCTTVGVAGLIQSGGFGNFSKNFGTAAANLLEAEIVTADGEIRIANACTNPDLFWAIKGGGGGSFGIVTRLTLRTYELPEIFGAVFGKIKASTDKAFLALINKIFEFYAQELFNPHWGEQIGFNPDNTVNISMVFQGMNQQQAEKIWQPLITWIDNNKEYSLEEPFHFLAVPARHFWDKNYHNKHFPQLVVADERPGALEHHILWKGDQDQAGWFIHGYKSAWISVHLLNESQRKKLVDAVFACTRHWTAGFHFNKGLAGARAKEIEITRDTAMNPAVLDAFALVIIAGGSGANFPCMPGTNINSPEARKNSNYIEAAMRELWRVVPTAGSYVSESDYFNANWQTAFWGSNYAELAWIKKKYDPEGLFIVHHGVGSEAWSADGFTPI
jgi:FAD/FMN-containing dehydrogenase